MLKKIYKYTVLFTCMAYFLAGELYADTGFRIDSLTSRIQIARPALAPVPSLTPSPDRPIDTLDTSNDDVKVVLFADNTWKYLKMPSFKQNKDVFGQYWSETVANPYKMTTDSLPYSWSLWLVDSLGQYHCPYKGDIHRRGKFGPRRGRRHQGVDIPLKKGDPIYATFTGRVRMSKYMGGFGNLVVIRHENGIETFYGHLSERKVQAGDWVNAGDVIGLGGSTGRSTGPHLHFETRYNGFAFDPQWLVNFETGELRHRLFVLKKKYFDIYSNYEQDFEDEWKNEEDDKKEEAERKAMRWHVVKSGETLGHIAIKNNTTVNEICRLNGITRKTVLKIGRRLRVR